MLKCTQPLGAETFFYGRVLLKDNFLTKPGWLLLICQLLLKKCYMCILHKRRFYTYGVYEDLLYRLTRLTKNEVASLLLWLSSFRHCAAELGFDPCCGCSFYDGGKKKKPVCRDFGAGLRSPGGLKYSGAIHYGAPHSSGVALECQTSKLKFFKLK